MHQVHFSLGGLLYSYSAILSLEAGAATPSALSLAPVTYHAPFLTNCVTASSICLSDRPGGRRVSAEQSL